MVLAAAMVLPSQRAGGFGNVTTRILNTLRLARSVSHRTAKPITERFPQRRVRHLLLAVSDALSGRSIQRSGWNWKSAYRSSDLPQIT